MKHFTHCIIMLAIPSMATAQVDYSVVQVSQESGTNLTKITRDNDYVCMPQVKRNANGVKWLTNRIIGISVDGNKLAYLSYRSSTTNIFIKDINRQGASIQRTNRQTILDFSYSPDGKYICFSETNGNKTNQIFQTSATNGYVCRQITSGAQDYSPIYSNDMKNIFFARIEKNGASIWGYNIVNNYLSSFTNGINPYPANEPNSILCTRFNTDGRGEIWRVNYDTGVEECVVSDAKRSFSTPSISPDGKWILFVGSNSIKNGDTPYYNTDVFVCHTDGTQLMQLTYHAADDLSPVWSKDGKRVYFISQRGSSTATANVWCMDFVH